MSVPANFFPQMNRQTLFTERSEAVHNLKCENINFLAPNTDFAAQNPDIRPFSPISCRKLGIYLQNVVFFASVGIFHQKGTASFLKPCLLPILPSLECCYSQTVCKSGNLRFFVFLSSRARGAGRGIPALALLPLPSSFALPLPSSLNLAKVDLR
jgi:hypothetical protein